MTIRLYFSFDYANDLWRANIVRSGWLTAARGADGLWDASMWESIKKDGEYAIRRAIDKELNKTSVTVVLIGQRTAQRKWIQYEIIESVKRGNGLLGVFINGLRDQHGVVSPRGNNPLDPIYFEKDGTKFFLSQFYQTYDWIYNHGFKNFASWVEQAAKSTISASNLELKAASKRSFPFPFLDSTPRAFERTLRVFLCHATNDKPSVRELYNRLRSDNVDPWLDEEKLLPGQDWRLEIPQAVRTSDVVIVCLSRQSINKTGYVQKELRLALDVADEQPEGAIYLIPARLEKCEVPKRLQRWHWVDLFERHGYYRLMSALQVRAGALDISPPRSYSASSP